MKADLATPCCRRAPLTSGVPREHLHTPPKYDPPAECTIYWALVNTQPRLNAALVIFVCGSWSEQQMSSQHSSTRLCPTCCPNSCHYNDLHPLWPPFVYIPRAMLISSHPSSESCIQLLVHWQSWQRRVRKCNGAYRSASQANASRVNKKWWEHLLLWKRSKW